MTQTASIPVQNVETAKAKLKERDNAIRASGIGEGRKLERAENLIEQAKLLSAHQGQIDGMTAAHGAELERARVLIGRAAKREGIVIGLFLGSLLVAGLVLGVYLVLKDAVVLNTSTQRVTYPRPPAITDTYAPEPYTRSPREPGDAK